MACVSKELTSGSGKGMYRWYESVNGGEWELKVDADITTHFVGRNYYVELVFSPENRGVKCRRIMKNERSLKDILVFTRLGYSRTNTGDPSRGSWGWSC